MGLVVAASAGWLPNAIPYDSPYATPVVEKPTAGDAGTFDGLLGVAESLPPGSSMKILWTHGMCTHPPGWVDDRMKRLVASVGGKPRTVAVLPIDGHGATLRTDRITLPSSTTIDVAFLTWSPLTARYKTALTYDHSKHFGGDFPYARAALNRELKRGLINDCMTDVVVYGGANGAHIRRAAEEAVCETMGGRIEGASCNVRPGASPAAIAFVTESLGSKLVFDAILSVWSGTEKSDDKTAVDRVAHSLAATRTIYMVANQLPLLDVAGTATAGAAPSSERPWARTNTHDVFDLLSRARIRAPRTDGPMTVVAFSDPNDLLSYRIVPGHLAGNLEDFRVVNVIVSNDTTYFDYIERPDTAHCGYTWNPHVFGMMARGYHPGKVFPLVPGLSGGVCPNFAALQE
jgi:hypothetical protein